MALDGGPGTPLRGRRRHDCTTARGDAGPAGRAGGHGAGEVVLIGRIASPPEKSGFGYMADLRVEHLWYQGREVLRGGGVVVFAADLSIGVGDRVRVDGEISRPQFGEDGFDYSRYLGTNSELLRATLSPKTPRTSRLLSGRTDTSRRSIL
jgi:hypothetical protein